MIENEEFIAQLFGKDEEPEPAPVVVEEVVEEDSPPPADPVARLDSDQQQGELDDHPNASEFVALALNRQKQSKTASLVESER